MHLRLLLWSLILSILIFQCCTSENKNMSNDSISNDSLISRGKYLVTIMTCADCHSPKMKTDQGYVFDPALTLSGHPSGKGINDIDSTMLKDWTLFTNEGTASVGSWGVSYAANITSDPTGVGEWTQEQFNRAMRQGKYRGIENSRTLLPPMPWAAFAKLTDNDLKAILAYLKTTKPVRNVPPEPKTLKELMKADTSG